MPETKKVNRSQKASKKDKYPVKKMYYIVVACNALAVLLSVSALGISVAAIASDDWSHYTSSNMTGLFMGCDYNGTCFNLDGKRWFSTNPN